MNGNTRAEYGLSKADYARLRERYTPKHPKIIFVLESPPISGKYFYNPGGRTTEPLFSAMMKDVLGLSPRTKHEGLTEFAAHGYLLVDATYTPMNIPGPARVRDKAAAAQIQKDFPLLVAELHKQGQTGTKLLLVKSNVCRLLRTPLTQQGFVVLNDNLAIPFPSNGQQTRFRKMVRQVLGLDSK
jgi:hypothetical protein